MPEPDSNEYEPAPDPAGQSAARQALGNQIDHLMQTQHSICHKSQFASLREKNPCQGHEITFAQLADNSRITPSQRKDMIAFYTEIDPVYHQITDAYREHGGDQAQRIAQARDWAYEKARDNRLQLVNGKRTWGEYLNERIQISKSMNLRARESQRR